MIITLPTAREAFSMLRCPRNIDEIVAPPTAISTQNATTRFISGKVMARPVIAIAPTPLPMNILSMILYSDVARLAIIAGSEYWSRSCPMVAVPSMFGLLFVDVETFGCTIIYDEVLFVVVD